MRNSSYLCSFFHQMELSSFAGFLILLFLSVKRFLNVISSAVTCALGAWLALGAPMCAGATNAGAWRT